jgi:hypothetical protein
MFPEYTVSLCIWIIPLFILGFFIIQKKMLVPEKSFAVLITVAVLSAIGFALDLVFGNLFFTFPEPRAVLGITVNKIPVEEFVFYIAGLWFILFAYVFCDEFYLKKYNPSDAKYAKYRSRIGRRFFYHIKSCVFAGILLIAGFVFKRIVNPQGENVPGYFFFLVILIYTPAILFYRVTKLFVNWRAFAFTLLITSLISIIWEVTLALPRGYWGYQEGAMLGVFIGVWDNLPLEAVTVWISGLVVILIYEFLKIRFFTKTGTVPGRRLLLKIGKEWRGL